MAIAGRHGELEGHMHGYDPSLVMRAIAQTVADRRLTYLTIPDEAAYAVRDRWPLNLAGDPHEALCMVPWRDEARQFTYYCLLDAGHDTEPWFRPGIEPADTVEYVPEHGWYRLLDAYARGDQAHGRGRRPHRSPPARRRPRASVSSTARAYVCTRHHPAVEPTLGPVATPPSHA